MARRGENIYKRKDGRWEGRYIKDRDAFGKTKYGYIYGKTYQEVKQQLLKAQTDYRFHGTADQRATYGSILDAWLDYIAMQVKESTFARYAHLVERHIRPFMGKKLLAKIETRDIEAHIQYLLEQGRINRTGGLSSKTVNDILVIIKATVKYARCRNYKVACNLDDLSVKRAQKDIRVLNDEEQRKLTSWLISDFDACKFGVLLSLFTGIRIGELCALKWKHIQSNNNI